MNPSGRDRIREIRRRLLDHYDTHRRDLPWRRERDPYRIWVSEVMLQQTRAETVIPYYRRWVERFPDLEDLAAADPEEVLREWAGLGYYSRARNLHRAARLVKERHDGEVPETVDALRALPGIGEYTAGAVASIAFDVPAPAVDGNVRRVLARLDDLAEPTDRELRERAAALVDPERPGAFNQALMELGATVCTPSGPACPDCPLEDLCHARDRGTVDQRPPPRRRAPVRRRSAAVAVAATEDGRAVLTRRPDEGLLAGMWEFPATPLEPSGRDSEESEPADLARRALVMRGLAPDQAPVRLEPLSHAFTHLRVTYHPFLFGCEAENVEAEVDGADDVRVVALDRLHDLPVPAAQLEIGKRARRVLEGG